MDEEKIEFIEFRKKSDDFEYYESELLDKEDFVSSSSEDEKLKKKHFTVPQRTRTYIISNKNLVHQTKVEGLKNARLKRDMMNYEFFLKQNVTELGGGKVPSNPNHWEFHLHKGISA